MRSHLTAAVTGLVVALAVVGRPSRTTAAGRCSTSLTGAEEAPGPGDANASGQADLTLNQGQNEACFDLSWADIDGTVFAGHIDVAPAGSPGPIVVPLFAGTFGTGHGIRQRLRSGCGPRADRV